MQVLNNEVLEAVLKWQSKRYIRLLSAIDSTERLKNLSRSSDEEVIDLELDVRDSILDELRTFDEEFKVLTMDLSEEDIALLLSKEYELPNLSSLEKALRKANKSSGDAAYKLMALDKEFNLSYLKEKSIYYKD